MRIRPSGLGAGLSERGDERPHILVVDGSLALRMDLRAALHGAGFHVTACESKASARQALRARAFGIAIVDAHLPDGSGLDLIKELRGIQPAMRWVVLAAGADARLKASAISAGAEDVVGKPLEIVPLLRLAVKLAGNPAKPRPPESTRTPVRRQRILIVDADPVFRKALAESLRADGDEVLVGASSEEALALLSVDRVDAVLIDFRLPEVGGLDLCRRVRNQSLQRFVPVLVVARPSDDVDAYRKAMSAGADDLVVRSKDPAMVKIRLRGLLSRTQKEREKREGKTRSPLDELSASLPPLKEAPAVPPKPRTVPPPPPGLPRHPRVKAPSVPPPGGFRSVRGKASSVPPPPGDVRDPRMKMPSPPSSQKVLRELREEPDSSKISGWSLPRAAGEDRVSGVVPAGSRERRDSREPWVPPSAPRSSKHGGR
ncbi:MAG: response regulator transcription factor [Polyangiaceae bacterium]|nr:response regulator transcription factor [Polyangiaceae bacterium]